MKVELEESDGECLCPGLEDIEGPITSSTMPLKSTWLLCFAIGSTNPGGGHTSSLNIEPVSAVRDFNKPGV